MKKLSPEELQRFLQALASTTSLVAPVREDGQVLFRPIVPSPVTASGTQAGGATVEATPGAEGGAWHVRDIVLDYVNTVRSGKELFFPQTEVMFRFQPSPAAAIEVVEPTGQTVLFGIRPCDLAALGVLDALFLGGDYQDAYYRGRRENTVLVGMACSQPDVTSCFCTAFGITPGSSEMADLMLYPGAGWYALEVLTAKGEQLLERLTGAGLGTLGEAGAEATALAEEYRRKPVPLGDALTAGDLWKELDDRFADPYWEEASRRCLGCGICTYLCPTCHCFLVTDEMKRDQGLRLRCWDSCQFDDFLLMAGGHNPRPTKKERTRQRFLHKLNYFPHRYGRYLCTGCGRCVLHCPVGLDMATVLGDLKGVTAHVG
ncbi:MAG TPA: sulfite reductase [Firmicutes bacterium]|nr:sulfite reductase [Bacillota bacterium]